MKKMNRQEMVLVNGGADGGGIIDDIVDLVLSAREVYRDWAHTLGCLIWGNNEGG